jgi:anti-sigma factor RsiW
MDCRDTIHLICSYLEGKLSPSVEREVARHLNRCRDCGVVLESATKTLGLNFEATISASHERVLDDSTSPQHFV